MSDHLDLDQLADALAGDEASSAHVASCAACQAELARLEQALPAVTSALAGLPLPAPPADLDARITAALRPAPVADLQQRRAARWAKPLAAVASAAAVAALVFGGMAVLGGDDQGSADRQAASGANAESATLTSSTGSAYRKDGKLLAQELPVLLGAQAADKAAPAPALVPDSGAGLPGGVRTLADPLETLRSTEGLAACIAALTEPGKVVLPLALDYATFEGKPALVVVMPSPKAGRVDVFVVGAQCSAADAALLYFHRYDRP